MRLMLLGALAALLAGCAAEGADRYYTADECLQDSRCRREWRREKAERGRRLQRDKAVRFASGTHRRIERTIGRDRGPVCQPFLVFAVGEKATSEENAEVFALRIWKSQVAWKFGEEYLDFHKARDPRRNCAPVGIADTITGKIREKWLGVTHWRCSLTGYPCKGRPEPVERD